MRIAVVLRACAVPLLMSASTARAVDCKDGGITQFDMDVCAGRKAAAAEAEMNRKLTAILGCLESSPGSETPLLDAQRAWTTFRAAECRFQASASEGGSVQPMIVRLCIADVTERRAKELDYYLTCREGDMSCPTWGCRSRGATPPRP